MGFNPGANLYVGSFGTRPENVEVPTYQTRDPATTDVNWPIGKRWINTSAGSEFSLTKLTSSAGTLSATWTVLGGANSDVNTLSGDSGTATPVGGNIQIKGTANQITTTGSAGQVLLALPNAITAPGSLTTTTTLTATTTVTAGTGITSTTGNIVATAGAVSAGTTVTGGTGVTATTGNITATNGNIVRGTAGNKDIYTSVASTTTAGANSAGTVTLVGGTATISTTAVTASSIIRIYRQGIGSTGAAALGILTIGTITAATSFVINSVQAADATALQASDVSVVAWEIVN